MNLTVSLQAASTGQHKHDSVTEACSDLNSGMKWTQFIYSYIFVVCVFVGFFFNCVLKHCLCMTLQYNCSVLPFSVYCPSPMPLFQPYSEISVLWRNFSSRLSSETSHHPSYVFKSSVCEWPGQKIQKYPLKDDHVVVLGSQLYDTNLLFSSHSCMKHG